MFAHTQRVCPYTACLPIHSAFAHTQRVAHTQCICPYAACLPIYSAFAHTQRVAHTQCVCPYTACLPIHSAFAHTQRVAHTQCVCPCTARLPIQAHGKKAAAKHCISTIYSGTHGSVQPIYCGNLLFCDSPFFSFIIYYLSIMNCLRLQESALLPLALREMPDTYPAPPPAAAWHILPKKALLY